MAAMKRSGSMLLMFLLVGFPVLNAGCGGEVPQPTMEASEGEIICTVPESTDTAAENTGEDAEASWREYLEEYGDELVYVELNEPVTLSFEGEQPEELEIRDSIIDENGALRYQERVTELRAFTWDEEQQAYTIYIPGHFGSMLSSDSADYEPGACLRGMEIHYQWNGEEYTSLLALRTDAGLM